MAKFTDSEGNEVEAFLPAEVDTKVKEAVTAKEAEFTPKEKALQEELAGAKKSLAERANQFATFRKLNDDVVAKLDEKDRIIYENGLALAKANEDRAEGEKKTREAVVESAIRAKAGTDEKLFKKMQDMWGIIGIEAATPEQIEQKTKMILGAISTTEPDLLANVSGWSGGGSYSPPETGPKKENQGFGDTERGKAIAADLGLTLEPKKK